MHKKALTVAIAGAMAVPMAAHAVDFSISGHVNRALFITDSDASTGATVKDNGSSGSRIRAKGSGELMDVGTAGVLLEYSAGTSLGLRYADLWYAGDFGKVSIGHGDQGGEGSVYKGSAAVLGTGHGQDHNSVATGYYTSLDGGSGRNGRIRYDSPSVGPVSAAISVGNGDQISGGLSVSQSFGDTSFSAGIGSIQWGGSDQSTVSGSVGATLPGGVSISGAWGVGKNYTGATDAGSAAVPAVPPAYAYVNVGAMGVDGKVWQDEVDRLQALIDAGAASGASADDMAAGSNAAADLMALFESHMCDPVAEASRIGDRDVMDMDCQMRRMDDGTPAVAAVPDTVHVTDPSFFQVAVSYAFGDTSVGVSWYQSNDMQRDGSRLVAIGAGVDHNLPKIGANVYAAAQNYSIEDGAMETDDTVIMIGTRIKF